MSATIQYASVRREGDSAGNVNRPFSPLAVPKALFSAIFAFVLLTIFPNGAFAESTPTEGVDAVSSYIVKETWSPNLLQYKDIDRPLSPASLTKIMTSMMAIESGRLDDVVTITPEVTEVEPTRAGFKAGERIRLRDLVKAAMVNSSNDAAFAIAVHLGGSVEAFVASMNARARAIGMNHTFFTNPAGYDKNIYAGNQSTARDLMILTERAIRYAEFNAIARLDRAVFNELSTGKTYSLKTHNKLFDRYPYTVGIKTGYTIKAGPCLIARAVREGKDMLIIMLDARTDRWSLASAMFDEGLGVESGRPVQVATVSRQDTSAARMVPAAVVLSGRAGALEVLKHRVARQSREKGENALVAQRRSQRMVTKMSVKGSRSERSKSVAVIGSRRTAGRHATMALRDGSKGKAGKKLLVKSRQRTLKETVVMRSGRKSGDRVALKSARSGRQAIGTTRKGAGKQTGVQARNDKKKNSRKGELSLSGKRGRSSNG